MKKADPSGSAFYFGHFAFGLDILFTFAVRYLTAARLSATMKTTQAVAKVRRAHDE